MKKCLLYLLVLIFWIVGCAGHFYRVAEGKVTFRLELDDARRVDFACSRDEYKISKVEKQRNGKWEISIPADFEFKYFFLVDGAVYLPAREYREADDFGSENCIFVPKP